MKSKLLGLVLSSCFAASAFASSSVAIVDLTQVFQQVPQGAAAFNTLKQQLAPQVTQLQTQQQSLQSQANALDKNKKLSKAEIQTQKTQIESEGQTLQQNIQAFQQSAAKQEQALLATFGDQVKATVAQLAKQDGYDIVLSSQSSLYTAGDYDLTKQVVAALQQQAAAAPAAASSTQ